MENNQRVHVWISGRVQGVFFRMETQRKAKQIGITGWVRNIRDGRVEAVIEGPGDKVAQMLVWCGKGPALSRVTDVERVEEDYSGDFKEFSIV
ncbi:MAG: acylphosphatase [Desulfobacteraceae bacterium]|nr:acylphosphatase [Desulfobacteraceae bacterium]